MMNKQLFSNVSSVTPPVERVSSLDQNIWRWRLRPDSLDSEDYPRTVWVSEGGARPFLAVVFAGGAAAAIFALLAARHWPRPAAAATAAMLAALALYLMLANFSDISAVYE